MEKRNLKSTGSLYKDSITLQKAFDEEFALRNKEGKVKIDGEITVLTTDYMYNDTYRN